MARPPSSSPSSSSKARPAANTARRAVAGRAFVHRAGVQLEGTRITCDAASSASDVVFLSHAQALGAVRRRATGPRGGRQELLVTEPTLALLGAAGERLRRFALPAVPGRPFVLGGLRIELVPAGHLPGSASLLVDSGRRRLLYAGTIRRPAPAFGADPCEVRGADAVCLDATFGSPRFSFPPPEEALAQAVSFVKETQASGRAPVLLAPPFSTAIELAAGLASAGFKLRAHRAIIEAAGRFRAAAAPVPNIARWAGPLGPDEVLLWPPEARGAALLGRLPSPRFAFVSGFGIDPEMVARVQAEVGIPLSNQSGFSDLLAYLEATGAKEVAVHRGFSDECAEALRARGYDAYALGPPRQLELFRG